MKYSKGFKESAIQKILMPNGISITGLSKEIGISKQTLYNWIKEYQYGSNDTQNKSRSPRQWKSEEKYSAVLEAAGLSGDDLGKKDYIVII